MNQIGVRYQEMSFKRVIFYDQYLTLRYLSLGYGQDGQSQTAFAGHKNVLHQSNKPVCSTNN